MPLAVTALQALIPLQKIRCGRGSTITTTVPHVLSMNPWVLRSLFFFAVLVTTPTVPLVASSNSNTASPFMLKFYVAFNEGADCPRLFELRNEAKRQGATNEQQKTMNDKLRGVGCFNNTSKRVKPE